MALLPSSRLGRSMPELPCHPIPFVMRRVVVDLRRPYDDELLVRASAVLKSQGPENWSRGRPGLMRARTNSRFAWDRSCGKIRGGENR